MKTHSIHLVVNGEQASGEVTPRMLLSDFIRDDLALTGTHVGCEQGACGACTILLDGRAVRSCLTFAVQAEGASITTIEGIAGPDGELHPVQQALRDRHGLQCGFCTPGVVVTACALLRDDPQPTTQAIREGLSGNLCRCTGYQSIIEAIEQAAEAGIKTSADGTVA